MSCRDTNFLQDLAVVEGAENLEEEEREREPPDINKQMHIAGQDESFKRF